MQVENNSLDLPIAQPKLKTQMQVSGYEWRTHREHISSATEPGDWAWGTHIFDELSALSIEKALESSKLLIH